MRKHIAIILAAIIVYILTSACSSEHGTTSPAALPLPPVVATMDGHWHQTKNDIADVVMSADVTENVISIRMRFRGVEDLYWLGSFDSVGMTQNLQMTSTADVELASSLFGSHDSTKVFKYVNGVLSYEFTMLGKTTTVNLARGE
jgi:hypothetical protein